MPNTDPHTPAAPRAHHTLPGPPRSDRPVLAALLSSLCVGLAACGGGGGGGAPDAAPVGQAPPTAPASIRLTGVAATGSAMVGATVRVVDARGAEVGRSGPVGADGVYGITLPAEARAPFVVEAKSDSTPPQVSVLDRVSGSQATANVTPITTLIAARLSPTGMPEDLVRQFEQAATTASVPTPAAIEASKQQVLQIIAPVRQALGDTTDPVSGSFAVGGVGHDKLLDSLAVTITPTASAGANIEVTVRTRRDDETPMPAVSFSSTTPAAQLPQVTSSLRREDFGASGTSARIEVLVAEFNRCYALPVDERVTSTTTFPRTAAMVKDGPCKTMYLDADPGLFLDNGNVVGQGAANGLFGSDTLVFDSPVYEYTRAAVPGERSEMVVFSIRWTNTRTQASDTMVVHAREDAAGRLKLYGNQYRYGMSVRPVVLRQTHIRGDSGHMDNLRSGYNLLVANTLVDGQPLFDRVEVVAPVGLERSVTRDVFVLRPITGFSYLRMTGSFLDTRNSTVVWMGGDWLDPTAALGTPTTSGRRIVHPIELDGSGAVWVDDPQGRGWNDDRLERLSHKSVWTFRYFLRGNTGTTPDAVQTMTTMSRAPSIREIRAQRLPVFTPSSLDWMRSLSMDPAANMFWMRTGAAEGGAVPGATASLVPPAITLSWEVPAGALAPTNVNGFGRTAASLPMNWEQRPGFDRLLAVPSTQRTATLSCTTATEALRQILCHDQGRSDRYSLNTMFSDFELWGKDGRQVEFSHSYATYIPGTRRTPANPVIERLNAAR